MSEFKKLSREEFLKKYAEDAAAKKYAKKYAQTAWNRYMQDKETARLRRRKKYSKKGAIQ